MLRKSESAPSGREVLLVHRPKYDDWSFPKGKRDPGEHVTTAAVREVHEETGVRIRLGVPLLPQIYPISGGREKQVHYWRGYVTGSDDVSAYVPNSEIDDLRWVDTAAAPEMLSYLDDVALLEEAMVARRRTRTLLVVRHARAKRRKSWDGPDPQRPLTSAGRAQAKALVPVLEAYGVARVVTSPSVRCARTVAPYARAHGLACEEWPSLSEEGATSKGLGSAAADLLSGKAPTVVCSHRPVLPELLADLGVTDEPLAPGEFLALHHRKGTVIRVERHLVR